MKIQSINGLASCGMYGKHREANNLMQPSFGATLSVKELQKFPLEKKLTYLFSTINNGDIVAVGKNFAEIHKGLSKAINGFNDIIKRILFIRHELSVPLAFGLGSEEELSCINIGEHDVLVAMDKDTESLEPTKSLVLEEGDVIVNNKTNIPISIMADYNENSVDNEDMELLLEPKNFVTRTINLEDVQQERIVDANKAALSGIKIKSNGKDVDNTMEKKLSFKDVGGMDKTLEALKRSVLYPIKFPFAYKNVEINKGIILYGKPGTGKTLVAEALAGESDANFIKLSGTDLESKYIGETEAAWRKIFSDAKLNQPSIIFIDEFDAIVKERGEATNDHFGDKVVNQILSLMSDLEKSNDNVFVIATTNKIDTIDSAVKRSGRFDKHIEILAPDKKGLKSIFDIHTRNRKVDTDFDIDSFIEKCESRQFTGADIKHVVNEAHTNSWVRQGIYEKMNAGTLVPDDMNKSFITEEDFTQALADWDKNQTTKKRKPIGYNK